MPYISHEQRQRYYDVIDALDEVAILTKGELEYLIMATMKAYMAGRESKYANLHDCTYAAQHCADEFRRRYLDVREDQARAENGDV